MTMIVKDRIGEASTTTGTGNIALAGALTGYRAFSSVCSVGDTFYYLIEAVDSSGLPTGDWETGIGTYSAASTLARTTVKASSNSNALVSFATGSKKVSIAETADYLALVNAAYGGGIVPSVIQQATFIGSGVSITLSATPKAGNLLVAFVSHWNNGATPGTGWTQVLTNNGTSVDGWFIAYKYCSASESTTQTPVSVGTSGNNIVIWEVSGATIDSLFQYQVKNEATATTQSLDFRTLSPSALILGTSMVIGSSLAPTITNASNTGNTTGSRTSGTPCSVTTFAAAPVANTVVSPTATYSSSVTQIMAGVVLLPCVQTSAPPGQLQLIASQTLLAAAPSVTFSGIPNTFQDLIIVGQARSSNSGSSDSLRMQLNGDTGANYDYERENRYGATDSVAATYIEFTSVAAATAPATVADSFEILIPNYVGMTFHKIVRAISECMQSGVAGGLFRQITSARWRSTAQVSSIVLYSPADTLLAGSTFQLYGRVGPGSAAPVSVPVSSGFTLVQGVGGSALTNDTTQGILLSVTGAGAVDRNALLEVTPANSTWTMVVKLKPNVWWRNYVTLGLYAKESGTGKIHAFCTGYDGAYVFRQMRWTNITTFSTSTDLSNNTEAGPLQIKLVLDSTNLTAFASYDDGNSWLQWYQVAKGSFLSGTIDRAGIFFGVNQQTTGGFPQNVTEYITVQSFSIS